MTPNPWGDAKAKANARARARNQAKAKAAQKSKRIFVGGQVFKDRDTAITFMQKNPGWTGKRFMDIAKAKRSKLLADAGFSITGPNLQNKRVVRYNGEDVWSYGIRKPKPKPKSTTPRTTGQRMPVKSGRTTTSTAKVPKTTKTKVSPPAGPGAEDFYSKVMRLFTGLNPNVGQKISPEELFAQYGVGDQSSQSEYETQQELMLQQQLAALERQKEWNTNAIQDWYGQVGKGVETARGRNLQSTQDLMAAEGGNVQGILESIGGSAAQGAGPVGATGASGVNTLGAIGAADEQYLADIQPLLQQEAASASTQELRRLAQQEQDLRMGMQQLTAQSKLDQSDKRAQLALQIMDSNNQLSQQRFANQSGLAETIAGLMLNADQMSAQQQAQVMDYLAKQGALDYRMFNDQANRQAGLAKTQATLQQRGAIEGNKSLQKRIDNALAGLPAADNAQAVQALQIDPSKYWASPKLMKYVKDQFAAQGLSLRDAQVRARYVAAVEQYGVHVKPQWLKSNM